MNPIRAALGPPPKGQDRDDEIFETLEAKVTDHIHYARYLSWFLAGISSLLFTLAFVGIFSSHKSYLIFSGVLALTLLASAVTCELSFRWNQRSLLITSIILNLVWLNLTMDLVIFFSLATSSLTQHKFRSEVVFHVLITVAGIASALMACLYAEFFYVLLTEKDPAFFSFWCCKRGKKVRSDVLVETSVGTKVRSSAGSRSTRGSSASKG